MGQIRTFNTTVPAGQSTEVSLPGDFIHFTECSGTLTVKASGLQCDAEEGHKIKSSQQFKTFWLENDSVSDITVTLTVGNGDFDNSRFSGVVEVKNSTGLDCVADITVSATSQQLLINSNTARKELILQLISGASPVRIGDNTAAANKGVSLSTGETLMLSTEAAIYAYNANGTSSVLSVTEIVD